MAEILVTGGKGFIGKHLVKCLEGAGHTVLSLSRADGDVGEKKTWLSLPSVDHVIHLAARNFVPDSWADKAEFIHTNVVGTQHALDYCQKHAAKMIFVSAYLYGIPKRLPIREDDPLAPNNPYALSKMLAEELCIFHAKYSGTPVTILRPFNVYGFGQRQDYLIVKIFDAIQQGEEIRLQDLTPKRDYVYVDDLVNAIIRALEKEPTDQCTIYNIGSGQSYSVEELVNIIQEVCASNLPVISDNIKRIQEISDVRADITYAQRYLQWAPQYSLEQGLQQVRLKLIAREGGNCG